MEMDSFQNVNDFLQVLIKIHWITYMKENIHYRVQDNIPSHKVHFQNIHQQLSQLQARYQNTCNNQDKIQSQGLISIE